MKTNVNTETSHDYEGKRSYFRWETVDQDGKEVLVKRYLTEEEAEAERKAAHE